VAGPAPNAPDLEEEPGTSALQDDFQPVVSPRYHEALESVRLDDEVLALPGDDRRMALSSRLRGTLVHRLLHRLGTPDTQSGTEIDAGALAGYADQLIRPEERAELDDTDALVEDAVASYRSLVHRPDVSARLARGRAFYEVPFTIRQGENITRGTIDCLIGPVTGSGTAAQPSNGQVTILEFKTGRPRPEHHAQALVYRQAAESMFPEAEVDAQLVYLDGVVDV
jgi:hypothetical protein